MLTNECHECENYIEFPDHGVGEQIECPHCGAAVVLTAGARTTPPEPLPNVPGAFGAFIPPDLTADPKKAELAATIAQLNKSRNPDALTAKHVRRPVPWRPIAGGAVIVCGIAALSFLVMATRGNKSDNLEGERLAAVNRLAQEAAAARGPAGIFGTKWFMSQKQVIQVTTNASQLAPGVLGQSRPYLDRPARVTYHFTNDVLLLTAVTFVGPSTPVDFEQTQTRLAAEYGRMPRAAPSGEYTLFSLKRISHFAVQHCLSQIGGVPTEQVLVYVRGGGDPKIMPKVPVTSKEKPSH